jgi:predicted RNA-binding protein
MANKSDLRATIRPEELANRKFFSIEEYGPEPIYTRETVPTRIKVKEGDITESHMNDGIPGSEVSDANKVTNE